MMAQSTEECIAKIAAAGKITQGDALKILSDVADRAEQMRINGVPDPVVAAAGELAGRVQEVARLDRLDALRNAAKRDGIMAQIQTNGGISKAYDTIRSVLHGLNTMGRESVESMWHGLSNGWQAALDNRLVKGALKDATKSGALDRDVSAAWWRINAGEDAGRGPAAEIAKLYSQALDSVKERLNAVGARIADATDFVTHTTHDPTKMRQAAGPMKTPDEAFASWWGATEPRLAEKTFEHLEDTSPAGRVAFGRSVFDALMTGIHMVAGADEGGYVPPAFEGSRNLARKVSQQRTLFWKDGEAWNDHMQQFGQYGNLHASVMMSLDRGARQIALMDKLGTNPAANLNMMIRKVQEVYRAEADGVKAFQNKTQALTNVMGRLDGSLNIPANMNIARSAGAVRTWEAMSSLGGVGVTHFASIFPTVTSELAHHGINRLETLGNMVKALVPGAFSDAATRDVLADLGAFADGIGRHTQSVIGDDSIPGRISGIASRFMDYTGIHYIFDHTKAGVRSMLAHNLARNADKDFGSLDSNLSQMLGKYGIHEGEWNILRAAEMPTADGRAYLTPSVTGSLDRNRIEALLRDRNVIADAAPTDVVAQAVSRFQQGLSDKLLSYYGDASSHAVVQAGVRERALLLGSTRPGTGWGEVARFLTQFKMWPVAAMNQVIGREIHMSLSAKQAVWNLGMLVALGVPAGYLRMSVNDLALGHPLRNPSDPKTLLAAAAQSGGLGIMGDFLFGETSRMGGGLVATLGGPVVSDADILIQMFNRFRSDAFTGGGQHKTGAFGDLWPDLAHFGVRHMPFGNLVYLKGALDYMLWYHLYEAASPGWWERTNRRLLKEQGRTMQGYAPGQGVPWTPWGIAQGR